MSLSCGIVGLPNVGKSTMFSALTKSIVESQNYPFTTIDPNIGAVAIPDQRIKQIADIVQPQSIIPNTVNFVDVAGLVKGASQGEGLGNQFLSHIREVDAIIQVVRLFDDPNIIHVNGSVDPLLDIEIILTELILADIQSLTKRQKKLESLIKSDKSYEKEFIWIKDALTHLDQNKPINTFINNKNDIPEFVKHLRPITLKPMLIAANMDEESIGNYHNHPLFVKVQDFISAFGYEVIPFSAKLELELNSLEDSEQTELMELYNLKQRGLHQIIQSGYKLLNYISYFTAGVKEVRAWTITQGVTAPEAAGVIHSDFQKTFIKAEVIHYQDFIEYEGEKKAKEMGKLNIEGKDYIVQDGDIILFRCNP